MHQVIETQYAYCCLNVLVDCRQAFGTFGCDGTRGNKKVLVFDGMTLKT
jgi:hypothetical protein